MVEGRDLRLSLEVIMATDAQLRARERNYGIFRIAGARTAFSTITRIGTDEESDLAFEGMDICNKLLTKMRKRGR